MKSYLQTTIYLLFFLVVFFSCDNFEDVPPENNDVYLVSETSVTVHSLPYINTTIDAASIQYPELTDISSKFTAPVEVYRISYNTTFKGEDVVASGLVCVPNSNGTYPIMSFQNGTNSLASAAPSVSPTSNLFTLLSMMASTGFVVTIPDYLGFGASANMFHPYLDKESTVQAVVDMQLAAKELIAKLDGINVNDDLYITGYSQGGWSTLQVQKAIETNSSSEFNLKASSGGSAPYNLVALTGYVLSQTTYPMPFFLAYIMNSYANLGMTTPIDSVFNEPYASRVPGLFDGTMDGSQINALLTPVVADLFTANFIENWNKPGIYESLYSMLQSNSIAGYQTQVPTLLLHGLSDTFIPSFTSQTLHTEFMSAGVSESLVDYIGLEGLDHTGAIIPAELQAIIWFIQLKDASI